MSAHSMNGMLRFLLPSLALVLATAQPLLAQQVSPPVARDFWCGIAFEIMTRDVPEGATGERANAARVYIEGGRLLLRRAVPILREAGYDDDALARYRRDVTEDVTRAIVRGSGPAAYSFEECSTLIGQ